MTLLWFIAWVIANSIGDNEPLLTDPVNVWTWTLILAVALDLCRQHTDFGKKMDRWLTVLSRPGSAASFLQQPAPTD